MWVAHPPGSEVLETARVVAARASMRALRLAPTPLTAQRSAVMEMVLLPLELGGCGTMDPATNLAKDIAVNTLAGLQHPAAAVRRAYTIRMEEATREQPMGGMTRRRGGRIRCEASLTCSSTGDVRTLPLCASAWRTRAGGEGEVRPPLTTGDRDPGSGAAARPPALRIVLSEHRPKGGRQVVVSVGRGTKWSDAGIRFCKKG